MFARGNLRCRGSESPRYELSRMQFRSFWILGLSMGLVSDLIVRMKVAEDAVVVILGGIPQRDMNRVWIFPLRNAIKSGAFRSSPILWYR